MSKNLSAKYYQDSKERLQKKAHKSYQNLSKEEKEKKWQYGCKSNKNLSEDEIIKLAEYRKNIIESGKMPYYNYKILRNYFNLENLTSL